MNIIIPMAGRGTRLRPHTLTVPKPLISIAGKPIVQRLVEDLGETVGKIDNIAFVVGDFGTEVENDLLALAEKLGAKGHICYQREQLGTAHAVLCAQEVMNGPVVVAFADTLFISNFTLDKEQDGVIWVQKVDDPSAYGVVKLDNDGFITDFLEKPKEFVSDLAIIGIYYFKSGEELKAECQYLIDKNIHVKGEFQLTDALENMKLKGRKFKPGQIGEWLDFGNKNAVVYSNGRVLANSYANNFIDETVKNEHSLIISPCFLGKNVTLRNAIVGPYVSIEENCVIEDSVVKNSLIQKKTNITNALIDNAMIGSNVVLNLKGEDYSLGDYTTISD
jgi:glucose-1-phosphate thymidylyltransferase